jgi:hypothetical protein
MTFLKNVMRAAHDAEGLDTQALGRATGAKWNQLSKSTLVRRMSSALTTSELSRIPAGESLLTSGQVPRFQVIDWMPVGPFVPPPKCYEGCGPASGVLGFPVVVLAAGRVWFWMVGGSTPRIDKAWETACLLLPLAGLGMIAKVGFVNIRGVWLESPVLASLAYLFLAGVVPAFPIYFIVRFGDHAATMIHQTIELIL